MRAGRPGVRRGAKGCEMSVVMQDGEYAALKVKIRELLDIDLDAYKTPQMQRRLSNFIGQHSKGVAAFLETMGGDDALLAELRDTITINVSEFFRDARQFELLRGQVLPAITPGKARIKIWSAACSRGQEPYSVAITLREQGIRRRVQLLATDLDREVLSQARAGGPYREEDLRNLSAEQRETCFEEQAAGHFVSREIRSMVTFREHNLLRDSFDTGFDLILCRNVMIYFSLEVKTELIERFRAALAPGGVLFIGGSEALLGAHDAGFKPLGGNFYEKLPEAASRAA